MASEQELKVASGVSIPAGELEWRFSPAGGPGGQHVNTSNTRAEVVFDAGASPSLPGWARERIVSRLGQKVTAAAGERRSQARNRDLALERLAARLSDALRVERARRPTRPTKSSQRRRVEEKRQRGELKRSRGAQDRGTAGFD